MISTAGDLIAFCFRVSGINGVGQTASADDTNDAMTTLTAMLGQWQRKRWLVPDLTETVVVATGALSYTVGPSGTFAIPRPDRIESAFVRFLPGVAGTFTNNGGVITILPGTSSLPTSPTGLGPGVYWNNGGVLCITSGTPTGTGTNYLDYPIGIIQSREDYNSISLKYLATLPQAVFYDSAFPVGNLFFWPVPPAGAYELHVFTKSALPVYVNLTDPLNLPPEYIEAAKYSLVVRLSMDWGMTPKPAHVGAMRAALNTIRMANTQIAQLQMPGGLPGRSRRGGLAAFSDPAFLGGR